MTVADVTTELRAAVDQLKAQLDLHAALSGDDIRWEQRADQGGRWARSGTGGI